MFDFKKKKEEPKVEEPKSTNPNERLATEVLDLKLQALTRKIVEQDIIIRRLLELVVMNIEHKAYDKYLLPRINAIKNILDKK